MDKLSLGDRLSALSRAVLGSARAFEELPNHLQVEMHEQMWGSTACGFGGMGGASMTTAVTVVVTHGHSARVYHAGRLAHEIECYNDQFLEDWKDKSIAGGSKSSEMYEREVRE